MVEEDAGSRGLNAATMVLGLLVLVAVVFFTGLASVARFGGFLSPDSVALELDGQEGYAKVVLPSTSGAIELVFPSDAIEPKPHSSRDTVVTAGGTTVWTIRRCASGCSAPFVRLPLDDSDSAAIRITYLAGDSEYLDELTIT